jgi:hypothetical protein
MPSASTRAMLDMGALQVIILNEMEDVVAVEDNACTKLTIMLSTEASSVPAADLGWLQDYLPQACPPEESCHV